LVFRLERRTHPPTEQTITLANTLAPFPSRFVSRSCLETQSLVQHRTPSLDPPAMRIPTLAAAVATIVLYSSLVSAADIDCPQGQYGRQRLDGSGNAVLDSQGNPQYLCSSCPHGYTSPRGSINIESCAYKICLDGQTGSFNPSTGIFDGDCVDCPRVRLFHIRNKVVPSVRSAPTMRLHHKERFRFCNAKRLALQAKPSTIASSVPSVQREVLLWEIILPASRVQRARFPRGKHPTACPRPCD